MFKKTKIAAVTAAVLGLSSMAIVPNAQALSLNEAGSTGQVLVFPYYNVNNDFRTSFNITNTTNKYKAVKMRFRESKTSNDVLDFNVYMSPQDMFSVSLSKAADGGVTLTKEDNTCTHPKFAKGASVDFRDVYTSVENSDMREGYLEVIEMGEINEAAEVDTNGAAADGMVKIASEGLLHDSDGMPMNCDVLELAWQQGVFVQGGAKSNGDGTAGTLHQVDAFAPGYPNANSAAPWAADTTVSAVGYYGLAPATAIVATSTGTLGNNDYVAAVAAVGSVGAIDAPKGGLAGSSVLIDMNNIAGFVAEPVSIVGYSTVAQHYLSSDENFYLLPSLASGNSATARSTTWGTVARDFGLDDTNVLPRTSVPSGINPMPMAHALAVNSLSNQYFVEGETSTDWVISAPMKKHGILNGYKYTPGSAVMAAGDIAIGATTGTAPTITATNGVWKLDTAYDLESTFTYYDREEQTYTTTASAGDFSPPISTNTPTTALPFNREVNILALSQKGSNNPSVLGSDAKQGINVETGFKNGWGTFDFSTYNLNALYNTAGWASAGGTATGAPLTGFMAGKGIIAGQSVGEVFPHIIQR